MILRAAKALVCRCACRRSSILQHTKIVSGGRRRAYRANIVEVRREIESAYAAEFRMAGPWRRLRLRWRIAQEVRRRMEDLVPPGGLY